ncbi:MAG: hypothetical protein J2P58_09360, partial [Acidimicrobiaceae bacterium]|nr:hypothetical protein [Acidimicrobiaceae bacterium]
GVVGDHLPEGMAQQFRQCHGVHDGIITPAYQTTGVLRAVHQVCAAKSPEPTILFTSSLDRSQMARPWKRLEGVKYSPAVAAGIEVRPL